MLNPRELMLGNLILDPAGQITVVELIHYKQGDSDHKPIPLTKKILEEWCGFSCTQSEWEEGYDLFLFPITIHMEDDKVIRVHCTRGNHIVYNYLHQIQNLYFLNTGEQLVLNVPHNSK